MTDSFYEVAQKDIIIGYHFRHIKDFNTHLPKIYQFWAQHLLKLSKEERDSLFPEKSSSNIFKKHAYLKIKKGEVGRWVLLFQKSIEEKLKPSRETPEVEKLRTDWIQKIEYFHKKFVESQELFPK